jgi:lysyl-tRNA synthetase class 2
MAKAESSQSPQSASTLDEIRATRLEKVSQLQQAGLNPFAYRWEVTHHAADLQAKYADLAAGEEVDVTVAIAGRILARRVFGKLAFFSLQDETGTIQLYLDKKAIRAAMADQPDAFSQLKQLTDVGDILGVKGTLKRTDKGELSIKVQTYALLTKALLPLPDKWHGLTMWPSATASATWIDCESPGARDLSQAGANYRLHPPLLRRSRLFRN